MPAELESTASSAILEHQSIFLEHEEEPFRGPPFGYQAVADLDRRVTYPPARASMVRQRPTSTPSADLSGHRRWGTNSAPRVISVPWRGRSSTTRLLDRYHTDRGCFARPLARWRSRNHNYSSCTRCPFRYRPRESVWRLLGCVCWDVRAARPAGGAEVVWNVVQQSGLDHLQLCGVACFVSYTFRSNKRGALRHAAADHRSRRHLRYREQHPRASCEQPQEPDSHLSGLGIIGKQRRHRYCFAGSARMG